MTPRFVIDHRIGTNAFAVKDTRDNRVVAEVRFDAITEYAAAHELAKRVALLENTRDCVAHTGDAG